MYESTSIDYENSQSQNDGENNHKPEPMPKIAEEELYVFHGYNSFASLMMSSRQMVMKVKWLISTLRQAATMPQISRSTSRAMLILVMVSFFMVTFR